MTTIRERYEGNFLEALDFPEGKACEVEIAAITDPDTEKDAAGKIIKKAIVSFKGHAKRLILGKTNYKVLRSMFESDPAKWIGQKIRLQRRYLPAEKAFGVQNERCIRVIPPKGTLIPKSARDYMGSATPLPEKP